MAEARNPELVRREIAFEREQLARAIDELRTETTSVKRRVGSKLKIAVPAGLAGALLLAAGIRSTGRLVARKLGR